MATYLRRDDWVTDAMGNAISGASVYVCSQPATTTSIPPSPLVQLYSDSAGANPITQPVTTDGYGHAFYYTTPGTYTVVYYSPQILETILPDQNIGSANVSFPITVAEGGTNATTAGQARINLSAAGSGANGDITSLAAIGNTTIDNTGYRFNDGTPADSTTIAATGWTWGVPFGSTGNGVEIANTTFTGTGYTGIGLGVQSPSASTIIGAGTIGTSGTITGQSVVSVGIAEARGGLRVGSTASQALITPDGSDIPLQISGQGIVTSAMGVQLLGANIAGKGLLSFGTTGGSSGTYVVQTTVGAAGGASAQPATPLVYLPIMVNIGGSMVEGVIAVHRAS